LNTLGRFPFRNLSLITILNIFLVYNFFVDRQIELPSLKGGLAYKLQIIQEFKAVKDLKEASNVK